MATKKSFVYVGPEDVFRGLRGHLVEREDRATHKLRLHFQPESSAIQALPCALDDVQSVEKDAQAPAGMGERV
jgi:hypothetical protein